MWYVLTSEINRPTLLIYVVNGRGILKGSENIILSQGEQNLQLGRVYNKPYKNN